MEPTLTLDAPPTVEVDTLVVKVLEGPDEGKSFETEHESLAVGTAEGNDLVLSDGAVSGFHLSLRATEQGIEVRDEGSRNGTFLGAARLQRATVPPGSILQVGVTKLSVGVGDRAEVKLYQDDQLGGLRGRSAQMRRLMAQLFKASMSDAPILIVGESGTGKELIARAVHDLSKRDRKPFEVVDCASISPNLVASELFGHERGAFTGADRQHRGAFERANGGTIFLDEIGELPIELQPNLLGALERKRFRRVGGATDIDVDVRVVAATNRDLREEVNQGRFRLDLYYRLAVVRLDVPPLRERPDDIELLVEHFVRELGHEEPLSELLPQGFMERMQMHRWPGNVRELRNVVEATLAMGELPPLDQFGTPPEGIGRAVISLARVLQLPYKAARTAVVREFEKHFIEHWISEADGNVSLAARKARMDRSHLFSLLKRHELSTRK